MHTDIIIHTYIPVHTYVHRYIHTWLHTKILHTGHPSRNIQVSVPPAPAVVLTCVLRLLLPSVCGNTQMTDKDKWSWMAEWRVKLKCAPLSEAVTHTHTHIQATVNMRAQTNKHTHTQKLKHTLTHTYNKHTHAHTQVCVSRASSIVLPRLRKARSLRCVALFDAVLLLHVAHAPQEAQLWHPLGARLLAKRAPCTRCAIGRLLIHC